MPVQVAGLSGATSIAAGAFHTCALVSGAVWCWGDNVSGELGRTGGGSSSAARPVAGLSGVVGIAAGGSETCALVADGTVRCWGDNSKGQLGSPGASTSTPRSVSGLAGVVSIAVGGSHACALLGGGGLVRCWGSNASGQLGANVGPRSTAPVPVQGVGGAFEIATGGSHSCALLTRGMVTCWGDNSHRQLGHGGAGGSTPAVVNGLGGVVALTAGGLHTCALLVAGTESCWGDNSSGQLGHLGATTATPTPVTGFFIGSGPTQLVAGSDTTGHVFACALLSSSHVRCWGNGVDGELGDGNGVSSSHPVTVVSATTHQPLVGVKRIALGENHACALLANGAVACWGANGYDQLGDPSLSTSSLTAVPAIASGAIAISAGWEDTCVTTGTGAVECWGYNEFGALGDPSFTGTITPLPQTVNGLSGPRSVSVGTAHSCAVTSSGHVECWGYGYDGELGDGAIVNSTSPVTVLDSTLAPIALVAEVSSGEDHACSTFASGTIDCWGFNQDGQLGDGTSTGPTFCKSAADYCSKFAAPTLNIRAVVDVSTGALDTCADVATGQAYCWGDDSVGEVGNGPTGGPMTTPAVVRVVSGPLGGITAISAGTSFACAISSDAALCWGANADGELGDGTTTPRSTPVHVVGL